MTTNENEVPASRFGAMYSALGDAPYEQILQQVQGAVATAIAGSVDALTERELTDKIVQYITDHGIKCALTADVQVLAHHIYHDMAGYSFISRDALFEREGFEEININAWNDIEVATHGKKVKTDYSFCSPQHAIDIISRMLRKTATVLNEATPRATADIGGGVRLTVLKTPVVDAQVAVATSIRKVNTQTVRKETLLAGKSFTPAMLAFLELCLMHGVSMCISGETGAGKTTLAGCLLQDAARTLRTYTIEEGSREWDFIQKDAQGKITNSVIHTRTRLNTENASLNIDQEALVKDALRFDPDIIAPGEIRGREAFEVMGVSNTGHTVMTTVHSNGTASTPKRIITLAKKAFDMSDATLYDMCCDAFPILVHMEKCPDGCRRVTEIREVTGCEDGKILSQMLFEWMVEDNIYEDEQCVQAVGTFERLASISPELQKHLLRKGARRAELEPFTTVGKER